MLLDFFRYLAAYHSVMMLRHHSLTLHSNLLETSLKIVRNEFLEVTIKL